MKYYAYKEFVKDTKKLVKLCKEYEADTLLAVARGGLTLGHAFAEAVNTRRLFTINSILYEKDKKGSRCEIFNMPDLKDAKKVLLLDDIVDSGQTIKEVLSLLREDFPEVEFKIATLFYKPTALIQPDFCVHEAKEWIEFFWEKDFQEDSLD
ncbi:phosphoribosyltransferase domain-containing protein [Sulfurimonas sp. MAG313]|nr:phosphoribosyltransferase family protein [Sulfurimonas sp. MAG313]MDF1882207.1 phosphoribosyltransferase domain-containing protein [Sulfurimonas sp. MAG313]